MANEELRIGVYVCECGVNIGSVVDVAGVVRFAQGLPNVVIARQHRYTCSEAGQEMIKQDIRQIQTTITTTSYALDGERAQLARAEAKDRQKLLFMMIGILTGFVLLCLCLDSPVPGVKRWIAVMAAFTVIVGAMVVPFFWPF